MNIAEALAPQDSGLDDAVLASDAGGLKDVAAAATPIPLVNKVDDEADEEIAREIAAEIHDRVARPLLREPFRAAVHPAIRKTASSHPFFDRFNSV